MANENFLSKIENFLGSSNSNYDGEAVIANNYFVFNNVIDQQEELEIDGGVGDGDIILFVKWSWRSWPWCQIRIHHAKR